MIFGWNGLIDQCQWMIFGWNGLIDELDHFAMIWGYNWINAFSMCQWMIFGCLVMEWLDWPAPVNDLRMFSDGMAWLTGPLLVIRSDRSIRSEGTKAALCSRVNWIQCIWHVPVNDLRMEWLDRPVHYELNYFAIILGWLHNLSTRSIRCSRVNLNDLRMEWLD